MSNIKDKLVEIAQKGIDDNATIDYEETATLERNDFDNACEEIADEIIEKLPELLADSEWVKLPAQIGDTIYFTSGDEIKQLLIRKIRLNGSNYITYFGYDPNDKSRKEINVYECYRITKAEAEAKLAKLKGAVK
ncbi:MAG: hypothetical protein RRZ69_01515 [Clostridia bacterium]